MRKHLKDYFIPHEGNEYKPHSLQKAAMTGMVVLVLLSFSFANVQSLLWVASDWMVGAVLPSVIVDMINDERADDALIQLKRNPVLDQAAQMKANDMAKYEYFAHFSPTGVSPWSFFSKAQYNFVNAGENLAIHFTDTTELVDAWIASPAHRANIMNGAYTETGIGIAEGEFEGFKTLYVVQFFGTPAAQPVVAESSRTPVAIVNAQEPQQENNPIVLAVAEPDVSEDSIEDFEATSEVLAETVAITENTELVPADPVSITIEDVVSNIEVDKSVPVEQKDIDDDNMALYSSFVSTTTGGVPASIDPEQSVGGSQTSYFLKVLTQPSTVLQIAYIAIGLLVLVSLLLSVFIEIRRQNPIHIGYSFGLLLLMAGLFYIQGILGSGAVVL